MGDAKVAYVKMQAEVATNQVVTHPCMCFTTHDKKTTRWTIIGGIFIGILVAATVLGIWYVFAYTSPANLGGNILYSTFHGGTQSICNYKEENVIAFSESGTLIGPVLEAGDGTRAGNVLRKGVGLRTCAAEPVLGRMRDRGYCGRGLDEWQANLKSSVGCCCSRTTSTW